jgi:hypothetical protein
MLSYEITAIVEPRLTAAFEKYMQEVHINEVLATGYFERALFLKQGNGYLIRYETDRRPKIDEYVDTKAVDLRADFLRHFPSGVHLTRQIWELLAELPGSEL